MSKIMISLVSDQTLPNVLLIKEVKGIDKYLFINTEKMKDKSILDNIISACPEISGCYDEFVVIEDSILDVKEKLQMYLSRDTEDDDYIVNITCGTKMMVIGLYEFISRRRAEIYYLPIGQNTYKLLHPYQRKRVFNLKYRIGIKDYLAANGVTLQGSSAPFTTLENTISFYNYFTSIDTSEKNLFYNTLSCLRAFHSKIKNKKYKLQSFCTQCNEYFRNKNIDKSIRTTSFAKLLSVSNINSDIITKSTVEFLIGGWLEDYLYLFLKKYIPPENIALNIRIEKNGTLNELDVSFIHENKIFVIEAKTSLQRMENGRLKSFLSDTLYKSAALKKEFGLNVNSYLITTDQKQLNNPNYEDTYQKRANLMDVQIIGHDRIKPDSINTTINGLLNEPSVG